MNDTDINKLSNLIDQKLKGFGIVVDKKFAAFEERFDGKLTTFEERFDGKLTTFEERLKKHTTDSVKELSTDVGNFIAENLFLMIEEKADKSDIDRLERKLDRVLDTTIEHGSRIRDIEHIPIDAHELRVKKSK